MENTVIKDVVLDKKFDGYGTNYNNFVAQSEITVTITLNEYRALVVDNAKAQSKIDEAVATAQKEAADTYAKQLHDMFFNGIKPESMDNTVTGDPLKGTVEPKTAPNIFVTEDA